MLVFGILFCIRRNRPSRYHDGVIFPDDDVRENIIHYDEEGVGKNLLPAHGRAQAWQGVGTCPPPWKCCKVFCALATTVKRSVDQLFMHYFHNFLESRGGSFRSFGLCFEGDD